VPFANARSGIAVVSKHLRQCQTLLLDQAGTAQPDKDSPHSRAELHPPGKDAVARRRADGRWTVGIRKSHTLRCKLVQVRRRNLGIGVVTADVSIPEIVCQDEEDIGQTFIISVCEIEHPCDNRK